MTKPSSPSDEPRVIRARTARNAAAVFHYGNILAIMLPIPLGLLWLGASMVVYAMNRHHPNPRVGQSVQRGAYVFYGVTGFFTAAATFIPGGGWQYYLAAWALAALVIIPWSVAELIRIQRGSWEDVVLPGGEMAHD